MLRHPLGAAGTVCLDFMHTVISVLYERVIALVPSAFRRQAFECPEVVPMRSGHRRADMTAQVAAQYANGKMDVVHDRWVLAVACHGSSGSCVVLRLCSSCSVMRSVRKLSGAHKDGVSRQLRAIDPDKMG